MKTWDMDCQKANGGSTVIFDDGTKVVDFACIDPYPEDYGHYYTLTGDIRENGEEWRTGKVYFQQIGDEIDPQTDTITDWDYEYITV